MKVLIACEFSGITSKAFRRYKNNHVVSCDFLPTEKKGLHYQGNVYDILDNGWDLMIAFPPCTYLTNSNVRNRDFHQVEEFNALCFVYDLLNAPIEHICIENPVGLISTYIRKPDQVVSPHWFGDAVYKRTGLWLKNLPPLEPSNVVNFKTFENLRTPLNPILKKKVRSVSYPGLALAMARQWSNL